jgi:hypothetical protein
VRCPQPTKLEIKFEPIPETPRKHKGWKWEVLLRPVKASPGSSARVREHPNRTAADSEVRRIRNRLREVAPYERWSIQVRKIQDTSGMYGIFVTFRGVMSEKEKNERDLKTLMLSKRKKDYWAKRKAREALEERASLTDITQITRASSRRR